MVSNSASTAPLIDRTEALWSCVYKRILHERNDAVGLGAEWPQLDAKSNSLSVRDSCRRLQPQFEQLEIQLDFTVTPFDFVVQGTVYPDKSVAKQHWQGMYPLADGRVLGAILSWQCYPQLEDELRFCKPTLQRIKKEYGKGFRRIWRREYLKPSKCYVAWVHEQFDELRKLCPTYMAGHLPATDRLTIARGDDSFVVKTDDGRKAPIPKEHAELFRLFATKVARGAPHEYVEFRLLNTVAKASAQLSPQDHDRASSELRQAVRILNATLGKIGTGGRGRLIRGRKGKGYLLNDGVEWQVREPKLIKELTRFSSSVFGVTTHRSDAIAANTPARGQRLPAQSRHVANVQKHDG